LYLDVTESGSIKFNFPGLEPEDMIESCALDIADRGGTTLENVGEMTGLTRERIRQIETRALFRLAVRAPH
jgi:DNA-directed RNA polymerase sigma subunit (sigma70/sigma32)